MVGRLWPIREEGLDARLVPLFAVVASWREERREDQRDERNPKYSKVLPLVYRLAFRA